jgi:predicted protein tyrosine phosphatase
LTITDPHPIPDSYWVVAGQFLAGEYPGALVEAEARRKLRDVLKTGIAVFIDLTEPGEYGLKPYSDLAREEAAALGREITHLRFPIPDRGTPSDRLMRRILQTIDELIAEGRPIYVHCYGGIGRTGTVVGCWMVEHGRSGEAALAEIERLRHDTPDGWMTSPETREQQQMVRTWRGSLEA